MCKFIVGAELENAEIFNEVVHIMCRQEKENKCELNFYEMMEPLFENMDTIYKVRAELSVCSKQRGQYVARDVQDVHQGCTRVEDAALRCGLDAAAGVWDWGGGTALSYHTVPQLYPEILPSDS